VLTITKPGKPADDRAADPPRGVDRELPHQVEITIPSASGRARHPMMHAFCRTRGYRYATHGIGPSSNERDEDRVCWCFTEAAHADAFRAAFGGERLTILGKYR